MLRPSTAVQILKLFYILFKWGNLILDFTFLIQISVIASSDFENTIILGFGIKISIWVSRSNQQVKLYYVHKLGMSLSKLYERLCEE